MSWWPFSVYSRLNPTHPTHKQSNNRGGGERGGFWFLHVCYYLCETWCRRQWSQWLHRIIQCYIVFFEKRKRPLHESQNDKLCVQVIDADKTQPGRNSCPWLLQLWASYFHSFGFYYCCLCAHSVTATLSLYHFPLFNTNSIQDFIGVLAP